MKKLSLRALALTCIVLTSFKNETSMLVQDSYPGAQAWFTQMAQKYPQANLHAVSFQVSDQYASGPHTIYFPEDRLQAIHQAYLNTSNSTNLSVLQAPFKEDEYLLLHEAKHVLDKHNEKGYVALAACVTSMALVNGAAIATATTNPIAAITTFAAGNSAVIASLYAYIRHQEHQADGFANQHADPQALLAGAAWFHELHASNYRENFCSYFEKTASDLYNDPGHPALSDRAIDAFQALYNRTA